MENPLTIEFGALDSGLTDVLENDPIGYSCDSAVVSAEMLSSNCPNVDLTFLPYEGTRTVLSGGREPKTSPSDLIYCMDKYNRHGFPFSVPFNGGLRFRDTSLDVANDIRFRSVMKILDALSESGAKHGVNNHVTIFHDSLLEVVNEKFPDLTTIASCIRFVGGRDGAFSGVDEYRRAFEEFDLVVPLNQHTTWEFLQQFRNRVDQMLVFLNLECCQADLRECFDHYCRLERKIAGKCKKLVDESDSVTPDAFTYINPPEIDGVNEHHRSWCHHDNAKLINRDDALDLIDAGVNKFKVARKRHNHPIDHDNTYELAFMFHHKTPRDHCIETG